MFFLTNTVFLTPETALVIIVVDNTVVFSIFIRTALQCLCSKLFWLMKAGFSPETALVILVVDNAVVFSIFIRNELQ